MVPQFTRQEGAFDLTTMMEVSECRIIVILGFSSLLEPIPLWQGRLRVYRHGQIVACLPNAKQIAIRVRLECSFLSWFSFAQKPVLSTHINHLTFACPFDPLFLILL